MISVRVLKKWNFFPSSSVRNDGAVLSNEGGHRALKGGCIKRCDHPPLSEGVFS